MAFKKRNIFKQDERKIALNTTLPLPIITVKRFSFIFYFNYETVLLLNTSNHESNKFNFNQYP